MTRGEAKEAKRVEKEVSAELYDGMMKLVIMAPVGPGEMKKLEVGLRQVKDLRVVLIGDSVDEGARVIVLAGKPIPLVSIIREIPPVE